MSWLVGGMVGKWMLSGRTHKSHSGDAAAHASCHGLHVWALLHAFDLPSKQTELAWPTDWSAHMQFLHQWSTCCLVANVRQMPTFSVPHVPICAAP